MARAARAAAVASSLLAATMVAGCTSGSTRSTAPTAQPTAPTPAPTSTSTPQTATPSPTGSPSPEPVRTPEALVSYLSIPALGLRDFPVRRYPGSPDDAAGTAIQNRGDMASPRGPAGGVGPGEVGNHIVTGHRLSSTQPFRHLPSLTQGGRVHVRSGDVVHVYEIRRTRWTSFRSPTSLAAQRAPVPGRPGVEATRAMITLSTCATIEDHAAGNFWADEFDNPEHRIDKIGVLVASRPVSRD